MSERKALLFNIPQGSRPKADSSVRISSDVKEASERIQTKMNEVRQRRKELVESISDRSMRESLTTKK